MMTPDEFDMLLFCMDIAAENELTLNPNPTVRAAIVKGLTRNLDRYGSQYCPCRVPSGDEDRDLAIVCPCSDLAKDLEEFGHCRCKLFFRWEEEVE